MTVYMHCVPGRMRLKSPGWKSFPDEGEQARRALQSLPGVRSAAFTPLTGSLVVHFDPHAVLADEITEALSAKGLIDRSRLLSPQDRLEQAMAAAGRRIGRAAVGWAVGRVLDASGLSVLAALI